MRDQGAQVQFPFQQELLALIQVSNISLPLIPPHGNRFEDDALREVQIDIGWRNPEQRDLTSRPDKLESIPNTRPAAGHLQHYIHAA